MSIQSQQLTILAVDDSILIQELLKEVLADEYNVLVADNAKGALSLIYKEPVALLLLDIWMPGVDGLELCRTLRSLPQYENLPIIMLTAKDKIFDKVQGRLAGATEYLTKPFDPEKLRQTCRKFLSLKKSTAGNESS